jgi:transcription elongation factor S-II
VIDNAAKSVDDELLRAITHDLETGVFNCALERSDIMRVARNWSNPEFVAVYRSVLRSVLSNLDKDCYVGNDSLMRRLLPPAASRLPAAEGAAEAETTPVKPGDVAFMRPEDMFPARWVDIVEHLRQRDQFIKNSRPGATTDQFKCARCKQRKCSYTELQTRSCDEPATIFVNCHGCGNRWRIG